MTLTEAAFYTRKSIKYGTFLVIFFILARIFWGFGYSIYLKVFPPPPPPPTVSFGRLPTLPFPQGGENKQSLSTNKLNLTLQTTTGDFPKTPTQALVYFMPKTSVSFLDLDEATKLARALGFSGKATSLSETIYEFEKVGVPQILQINIVNKTFSLNYKLSQTPELLTARPRSSDEAISAVRSFLSSANLLTLDLTDGTITTDFLKVQDQKLVPALSLSEANFIRVNLFRKNYNDLAVLTSQKTQGNVWFLVSGGRSADNQIVAGEYHYFPVDEQNKSTYPIKSAKTAWEELQAGKGYIVNVPKDEQKIFVRRVYLAYFDSGFAQGFLQPIFAFEGDNGFAAYVPALTPEYYGSTTSSESTNSAQPSQ